MQVNTSAVNALYEFGPFRLDPAKRVLLRSGEPVPLTPKAFDTLLALVQSNGRPLSREDLMQAVWPDSFVEEANLTQNIFVLRKTLGSSDRYIVTLPGRGYQFAEQVREIEPEKQESKKEESEAGAQSGAAVSQAQSRRGLAWTFPLLGLLALATGAGLLLRSGRGSQTGIQGTNLAATAEAAVPARRSLAVLGFRNSSGRPDEQWISTAFSEMLNTELAAGNQLRMVSGEDVARAKLESPLPDVASLSKSSLLRLREQLGTDMVVLGSYTALRQKGGERIRFDLRLQDTRSGETIAEESATGSKDELFQLVTQMGSETRQKLGIAGLSGDESGQVRATVAANPEATRLYAQGLDKLRKFDAQGARNLLEKAIAADPSHALSHSALAEALFDLGYDQKAQEAAKRAFDLSGDLARADHLLIEGRYRQFSRDSAAAIEIYQTLRDFFPDQIDYALYLANAQWKADHNKDALQTIARMRKLPEPEREDPRIDLLEANVGDALGDFKLTEKMGAAAAAKAQRLGSRLLLAQAKERQGWALEELGVYDQASGLLVQARELFSASGNPLSSAQVLLDLGDVAYDRGDLQPAAKFYSQALAEFRRTGAMQKAATALSRLGSVATDQGDLENGKRYEEGALRLDREIGWFTARDMGNLAIVLTAMGDLPSAVQMNKESAQSFHRGGDKSNEAVVLVDLADTFLKSGDIPSARQNIVHSTAMLRETGDQRDLGYALFTYADLLRTQDQLDQAVKLGEEDSAIRRQLGDRINLPRTQLLLAQIALDQGKAMEAETLAQDAGRIFDAQHISNWSALAYACMSEALLEQGKLQAAQLAANRAIILSRSGREVSAQMEAALAQAGVTAAAGQAAEAERMLQALRRRALGEGYRGYELRAELALGTVEMNSNRLKMARQRLTKLQSDAQAEGFLFIARKARTALHGGSSAL
ncbi:MAG TPA: winged helix-turn-helix domain-containing protein [Terriglobales bacterium]|nr:winged helix-turn-helix domain-containing protein [Terriglobales bacterium]